MARTLIALVIACAIASGRQSDEALALDREVTRIERELRGHPLQGRPSRLATLITIEERAFAMLGVGDEADDPRLYKALSNLFACRAEFAGAGTDQSIAWMKKSVQLAEASGYAELLARAHVNLARTLADAGLHALAEEVLLESLASVEAPRTRPWVSYSLASVEQRLGRYSAALERLAALEDDLPQGPAWQRFDWRVPGLRGLILLYQGLPDLAAPHIESAFEATRALLANRFAWAIDLIAADIHLANLYLFRGQLEEVVAFTQERLADAELYAAYPRWRAVMRGVLGQALARLGRHDSGRLARAEEVLRGVLASDSDNPDHVACEVALASLLVWKGEYEEADRVLKHARAAVDEEAPWTPDPQVLDQRTVELSLALARGVDERELSAASDRLTKMWRRRLEMWSETPPRRAGLGFLAVPIRRAAMSESIRACLVLDERGQGTQFALQVVLDAQACSSMVRAMGGAEPSLDAIRSELLGPGHGVVLLLAAPDRSHLFLFDRGTLEHYELGGEAELAEARERWLGQSDDPVAGPAAAQALSRALFPPGARARIAEWRAVSLVESVLGRIPFEELPLAGGRAFGASHALDFLPSLPLGLLLVRRADQRVAKRDLDLCLVMAPLPSEEVCDRWPEVGPLEISAADRAGLVGAYSAKRYVVLEREGATASALLDSAILSRSTTLHVLAHSVQDPALERPAALALTPEDGNDGLLRCDAIDANEGEGAPSLVVLTACRSGRGPLRRGDQAAGHMGGAWLFRGAEAVLLTDQDLPLGTALEVSRAFHRRLADGDSPAESLQALRADDGLDARGIFVLGLGQRPLFARARPRTSELGNPTARDGRLLIVAAGLSAAAALFLAASSLSRRRRRA